MSVEEPIWASETVVVTTTGLSFSFGTDFTGELGHGGDFGGVFVGDFGGVFAGGDLDGGILGFFFFIVLAGGGVEHWERSRRRMRRR